MRNPKFWCSHGARNHRRRQKLGRCSCYLSEDEFWELVIRATAAGWFHLQRRQFGSELSGRKIMVRWHTHVRYIWGGALERVCVLKILHHSSVHTVTAGWFGEHLARSRSAAPEEAETRISQKAAARPRITGSQPWSNSIAQCTRLFHYIENVVCALFFSGALRAQKGRR